VITTLIGHQIALNFQRQKLEADFRHHMVRVREYSESIALDGARAWSELADLRAFTRAGQLPGNSSSRKSGLVHNFSAGAAVVFPFVVAAPRSTQRRHPARTAVQIASAWRVVRSTGWWTTTHRPPGAPPTSFDQLEDNINASKQSLRAMQFRINAPR
jgi:putative ATP-binding cassette transporter